MKTLKRLLSLTVALTLILATLPAFTVVHTPTCIAPAASRSPNCTGTGDLCRFCEYCFECDWDTFAVVRCATCHTGIDCAIEHNVGWCYINNHCLACCLCEDTGWQVSSCDCGVSTGDKYNSVVCHECETCTVCLSIAEIAWDSATNSCTDCSEVNILPEPTDCCPTDEPTLGEPTLPTVLATVPGLAGGHVDINIVRLSETSLGFTVAEGYTAFRNLWLAFDFEWSEGITDLKATSHGNQGGVLYNGKLLWNFPEIGMETGQLLLTLDVVGFGTLSIKANTDAELSKTTFEGIDVEFVAPTAPDPTDCCCVYNDIRGCCVCNDCDCIVCFELGRDCGDHDCCCDSPYDYPIDGCCYDPTGGECNCGPTDDEPTPDPTDEPPTSGGCACCVPQEPVEPDPTDCCPTEDEPTDCCPPTEDEPTVEEDPTDCCPTDDEPTFDEPTWDVVVYVSEGTFGVPEGSLKFVFEGTGEYGFVVPAEYLPQKVGNSLGLHVFRADDDGAIIHESDTLIQKADGSLTFNVDLSQTYILAAPTLGDVTGTGTVEIEDALQILRSVVGLSNVIDDNDIALMAANITNRGKKVDAPEVADALQILRSIVGLPTAEKLR